MKSCRSRPKVVPAPDSAHLVSLDRRAPCAGQTPRKTLFCLFFKKHDFRLSNALAAQGGALGFA